MAIYLQPFKKYAAFKGRARRKEYWGFLAFIYAIAFVAGIVLGTAGATTESESLLAVQAILTAVTLVPTLAVGVRRLHDSNRSGWWILMAFIGGGLAKLANKLLTVNEATLPLAGLMIVVSLVMLVSLFVFLLLPGTAGDNRFGPNPRDAEQ